MNLIHKLVKTLEKLFKHPLFLIIICVLIFFYPVILLNQVFYYGDILSILPLKQFFSKSLASGVFPLWLPHILSGYPIFADITAGTYYLPYFFLLIFPSMTVLSILVLLHFAVSGYGAYKLGRFLNLSYESSIITGIIYAFSGLMVNYTADLSRFFVISLLPLFYYSFLRVLKNKEVVWILITSIILSFQIFAGHVQYVFIQMLAAPVFLLLKGIEFKSGLRNLIFISAWGVLLSSVAILPALEITPLSTRISLSNDIANYNNFSLNPLTLIRFIFSNFWGVKNEGSAWGIMETSSLGYIGFIPILFIAFQAKKLFKRRETVVFLSVSAVSLFLSFGTNLPFFKLFITIIPVFKVFRNPMVFLALYTFFMSVSAGFAFDLFRKNYKINRIWKFLIVTLFLSSLILFLIISVNNNIPNQLLIFTANLIHKPLSLFHTQETDSIISRFILKNMVVVSLLAMIVIFTKNIKLAIFVIFLDLFIFSRSNLFLIKNEVIEKYNPIAEFLQKNLKGYRYVSTSEIVPYSGMYNLFGNMAFRPPFSKEDALLNDSDINRGFIHEMELIPPDFSSGYGINTISGIATFVLKDYSNYFESTSSSFNNQYEEAGKYNSFLKKKNQDTTLTQIDFSKVSFDDPILNILSVKYIVTDRDLKLDNRNIVMQSDNISVYENKNAESRAVILNPEGKQIEEARIIRENANKVIIQANNKGQLIVRDMYYPGWKAYVEGKEIEVKPFEKIFRSVTIDNSGSIVTFIFQPLFFYIGALVSGIAYVITMGLLIIIIRKKYYHGRIL